MVPAIDRVVDQLSGRITVRNIQRGDLFMARVPLVHAKGSEQTHDDPTMWLVVSADDIHRRLPIVVAVPLTSKVDKDAGFREARIRIPANEWLGGTTGTPPTYESVVLTEQIRVLSHERLTKGPIARLTTRGKASVEAGLKHILDLA